MSKATESVDIGAGDPSRDRRPYRFEKEELRLMADQVFDFFARPELPSPTLGIEEVVRLMDEVFGLRCTITELGSQQDQNFVVSGTENVAPIGVLKLSNPVFSEPEIDLQDLAARTVAEREPALRFPQVVAGTRGPMSAWWNTTQGRIHGSPSRDW